MGCGARMSGDFRSGSLIRLHAKTVVLRFPTRKNCPPPVLRRPSLNRLRSQHLIRRAAVRHSERRMSVKHRSVRCGSSAEEAPREAELPDRTLSAAAILFLLHPSGFGVEFPFVRAICRAARVHCRYIFKIEFRGRLDPFHVRRRRSERSGRCASVPRRGTSRFFSRPPTERGASFHDVNRVIIVAVKVRHISFEGKRTVFKGIFIFSLSIIFRRPHFCF